MREGQPPYSTGRWFKRTGEETTIFKTRFITIILIIALIVLAGAYYFLGRDYLESGRGNEALTSRIAEVGGTLARTPPPPRDGEQRLAAAQASLAAGEDAFPHDLNSTRVINAILEMADDNGVSAIPLITQPWSAADAGGGYSVFRLNVTARGSFPQLVSFVERLENGELDSLIVEQLSVSREAVPPAGASGVTASLDLAVYSRVTTDAEGVSQ